MASPTSQGRNTQSLLYVSDPGTDSVKIFAYPGGSRIGGIGNLNQPAGLCVDKSSNVWIVQWGSAQILKYAHGSGKKLATLTIYGAENLLGCAVDPASGDLAATAIGSASGGSGLWVFAGAKGQPKKYTDSNLIAAYFCSYDGSGNLFVDGLDSGGNFAFFELPAGSGKLVRITLNQTIVFPGGVQWDGRYLAIGDQAYGKAHESAVYRVSVSGSSGTVKGTTVLLRSCDVLQFAVAGSALVAPDGCKDNVKFYKYPAGGAPSKQTLLGFEYPVAALVAP